MHIYILFDTLRHFVRLRGTYVPKPTYQNGLVRPSTWAGLESWAKARKLHFFGLQDKVLGQQVLRTVDEGMQAKNRGFLA